MRVSDLLVEGKRDKNLSYEDVPVKTKKGEAPSKVIDKVILKLEGSQSKSFTNLANKYKELKVVHDEALANLNSKKDELRSKMEELFDAKDELSTRIVETCSLTLQLNKAVQPTEKEETDYQVAYNALLTELMVMVPDLSKKIEMISECAIKAATSIKTTAGKASAFTVKEGVLENAMKWIKNKLEGLTSWFKKYDAKLAKAQALAAKLK